MNNIKSSARGHGGYGWKYGLIDLSSNMNPLGTPKELIYLIEEAVEQSHYSHYPTELGDELREALASYEGIDPSMTYVFNGATEALQMLIMHLRPRRVVIPIPNYSDYIRISRLVNTEIVLTEYWNLGSLSDLILDKITTGTVFMLSNPNSPMGYLIHRDELLSLAEEIKRQGSLVIVDESFMDFVKDNQSLIKYVDEYENIIVVKSYTKFLAIPGLRIGAVYTRINIEDLVPTWPTNSIVEYAVSRFMNHAHEFRELTVNYVYEERSRVFNALRELNINYYDSSTHYFVIKHRPSLGDDLLKFNFLIRDLSNIPPLSKGYFRVSIRSVDIDNEFLNALSKVIQIKH
ncbi:class I/II aminotransferase [Vulcanisaeta moutnovskia 768-28]|uniref:Aminotransferase n=1 Tax=Vulcanisaeta moutnovskia (strain 768-28) TaxID=985053 RepID=F0QSM2_VULM7|nr:histidinol-phosphate transaminase [Vulcanisaeta moutnovskia]ADY01539.1 class I/II aminotransferase [Vulcanisaeta moutnovskia 768-28]